MASFRRAVILTPGRYRFEGRLRTFDVQAVDDEKGGGAGLRISGSQRPRKNRCEGTSRWRRVSYGFEVDEVGMREVVLVCELRGSGRAWFDLGSLRLLRSPE